METAANKNLKAASGFGSKVTTGNTFEIVYSVTIGACVTPWTAKQGIGKENVAAEG